MDFELLFIFCLVTFIPTSSSYKKTEDHVYKHEEFDDYYDSEEEFEYPKESDFEDKFRLNDKHLKILVPNVNEKQEDEPTETPEPKYEVTEIIDDIPNNATYKGPVITNFTIAIPLNNATVINNTNTDNTIDINKGATAKRNYISVFHIKAEYDNDKPEITVIQNNRPNIQAFQGLRDYIKGVRQGIVNGLQKFINNYNAPDVHNIVNAPVVFLNKLQRKSAFAGRKEKTVFDHEFGNNNDDYVI